MSPRDTQRAFARAPTVVEGTSAAATAEATAAFEEAIANTQVDPRVWTGAFATNVWGGRYAVDGVLGEGAQGSTFVGTDLKTGARVALKVFDLGRAKDWKSAQLFEREVETLKSVQHAGIPVYLDVVGDDDSGARAIVRTLIPGDSLAHVLQHEGTLGEAALWRALVDVVGVLEALHERPSPIIHRDIKPQNLIRKPDGTICVVDFGGVGRMRDSAGSTVVGTFGYMAPEQLYGAQTPATDVYALGATLLYLATGTEPEDLPRSGLAIDVDAAVPRLSDKLRTVLKRMLAPDPAERPASARALRAELDRLSAEPNVVLEPELDANVAAAVGDVGQQDVFRGLVQLIAGFLGAAGTVVVGELLLPFLFTILGTMSSGAQREKLFALRNQVRTAATAARGGFLDSAWAGKRVLEAVEQQERERNRNGKGATREQRRAQKRARKAEWEAQMRAQKEQWRAQQQLWKQHWKEQKRAFRGLGRERHRM